MLLNRKIIFIMTCGLLSACSSVNTWFLGTDNLPKPTPLADMPTHRLQLVWSQSIGSGLESQTFTRLQLATEGQAIYAMDVNGAVQASDIMTGRERWRTKLPRLRQGVALSSMHSALVVASEEGQLIVLDSITGQVRWKQKTAGILAAVPLIAQDKIITRSLSGAIQAFNIQDGTSAWSYLIAKPELVIAGGAPSVLIGDAVMVPTSLGQLGVLSISTGEVLWGKTFSVESTSAASVARLADINAAPVVDAGEVYVGLYNGDVYALQQDKAQTLWQTPVGGVFSGIAVDTQTVYVVNKNSEVLALDRETGRPNWHEKVFFGHRLTRPQVINDVLVMGDYQGMVHLVSKTSGVRQGSQLIGNSAFLPDSLVYASSIFLQDVQGKLYRIDVK